MNNLMKLLEEERAKRDEALAKLLGLIKRVSRAMAQAVAQRDQALCRLRELEGYAPIQANDTPAWSDADVVTEIERLTGENLQS